MEDIVWVETPKCSKCRPDEGSRHRLPCIGCSRLMEQPKKICRRLPAENEKPAQRRSERNKSIVLLRSEGMSYGKIARTLGIPRSTVQSIVLKSGGAAAEKADAG